MVSASHAKGAAEIAARGISVTKEIAYATVLGLAGGSVFKARTRVHLLRGSRAACRAVPRALPCGRLSCCAAQQRPAGARTLSELRSGAQRNPNGPRAARADGPRAAPPPAGVALEQPPQDGAVLRGPCQGAGGQVSAGGARRKTRHGRTRTRARLVHNDAASRQLHARPRRVRSLLALGLELVLRRRALHGRQLALCAFAAGRLGARHLRREPRQLGRALAALRQLAVRAARRAGASATGELGAAAAHTRVHTGERTRSGRCSPRQQRTRVRTAARVRPARRRRRRCPSLRRTTQRRRRRRRRLLPRRAWRQGPPRCGVRNAA